MRVLFLCLFILAGCSSNQKTSRDPGSNLSYNACTQGIQAFFDESSKKEIGLLSEAKLIDKGLLNEGELDGHLKDPVYKYLIESEDEALREDSAKIIALIRRYKPDYDPKRVIDFYHELFHSCKL